MNANKRKLNPKQNASVLSSLTFWWMLPIFRKGYKTDLDDSDLFETLHSQRSDRKGDLLEAAWIVEKFDAMKSERDPSLTKVLIKVFGPSILFYGVRFAFVEVFIKMLQPVALGQLVLYYSSTTDSLPYIILYSSIIVSSSVFTILIYYPTLMATFHKSLKLKVACASLIYRKSLRLSKSSMQRVTSGHIINLISADLNSMDLVCFFCHHLWIGPLVTIIATFIMYKEIGACALLGVALILLTIPFQGWLTKVYATLKKKGCNNTDERLQLMTEIIKGIQVIKMYAWEKPFKNFVSVIREKEILLIKYALYIKGLHVAFPVFRTRTAIFSSILLYVITGNVLTARKAFVLTACFNTMRHTMTDFFSFAIELLVLARVSVKRIEKFLLQEEKTESAYKDNCNELITDKVKISFKNVSASWNQTRITDTLSGVNFEVNSPAFVAVIGAVGSGKSSLLHVILKELQPNEGKVTIKGRISYASQEPWLFSGSIQSNILFGSQHDDVKYNEIIKICSLREDFASFEHGDQTLVGDRGVTLSGGQRVRINLARALYHTADIYLLDDPFSALDSKVANEVYFNCIHSFLKEKICVLITHQHQYLKNASEIILLDQGVIKGKGSYEDINTIIKNESSNEVTSNKTETVNKKPVPTIAEEKRQTGRVSWNTFKSYFKSCGSKKHTLFIFSLFILAQFFASSGDYYLKHWVNVEQHSTNKTFNTNHTGDDSSWFYIRRLSIYSYTGITISNILITLTSCLMFYNTTSKASIILHDKMLNTIMSATMHFFNTNPSGRILNRFSKDVEIIDIILPYSMINCLQTILSIIGVVTLITIVNPWLILPTLLLFLILNVLRRVYLTVSSNLKRLESTTRSPLLSTITTTLQGLPTIRAYNAQKQLQHEFDSTQDVHTTARFLNIAASRMFAMWLEIICAFYLALVIFSFLLFGNEYGGNVGLAITQVMSMMGSIQWGIRQSSELENHMTAVERILEYQHLDDIEETPLEIKPPDGWPNSGRIQFENVYLTYHPNQSHILKNLSFTTEPREKIAIIGRTGSGKSSLINALFQLSPTTGRILIDNLNISQVNLQTLRSHISIIPQEPILFTGTIRKNLDPLDEYNDTDLFKVISDVSLDISTHGLHTKITENGANFSVGQKQLICLARAIIRNNKILILDEATSNIDPETDSFIQKIVKNKFADCTILIIAHRLETIMDSDKILTIKDGEIIEFDHPYVLLQNKHSYLSKMLTESGEKIKTQFISCSKKNYEEINKN